MSLRIVSKKFDINEGYKLNVAKKHGAYASLEKAFKLSPDEIRDIIADSGLRGKGGGGGSTGKKWKLMPKAGTAEAYLVINADESEPGTFKDRYILAKDPHLLLEGIIISAYALGAKSAYIYMRGEYFLEHDRVQNAIDEAYKDGILGKDSKYGVNITLHKGAGAYICGEKTALLNSLEGKRGTPRLKPFGPANDHLYGHPCVVNNVETISTVPFIVSEGAAAYKKYGTEESPGFMLFGVSGCVNNSADVVEVPFGMKMMDFINEYGGGVKEGTEILGVIPGGSSTRILTKEEAEKAVLSYEGLKEFGSSLGTGGMIVINSEANIVECLINLIDFYKEESCGQCTPCREGTGWALNILKRLKDFENIKDIDTLIELAGNMNGKTICVFAPAVADVLVGFLTKFRRYFENYIKGTEDVNG